MNVKILDCTLRDGGYLNNWAFEIDKTKKIIELLLKARVDFIELGFLRDKKDENSTTVFSSFDEIENITSVFSEKLVVMMAQGAFSENKIPDAKNSSVKNFRLIFKKHQKEEALKTCEKIKKKGYKLFINPTYVSQWEENEFVEIIKKTNEINPFAFSIVDSTGTLNEEKTAEIFNLVNKLLNKNIKLCFHCHNASNLAFLNAKKLIEIDKTRDLIIDSTILGMGRNKGNLKTEELISELNKTKIRYEISPILKIKDEIINPIIQKIT